MGRGRCHAAPARAIGVALAVAAVAAGVVVGLIVSNGHPGRYISQQWHGFAHQETSATSSHFTDVGSGRYDFWRVSLDAFKAHPVDGIGMDNFADYYIPRGRSGENPSWPHSLEMRLLAMTGIVGAVAVHRVHRARVCRGDQSPAPRPAARAGRSSPRRCCQRSNG